MNAQSPLIVHPENQSNVQRVTFGTLTAMIWAGWIYLWLPLVTTILWIIGIRWSYLQLFAQARGFDIKDILIAMLICIAAVIYWSSYNYLRFRGKDRRKGIPPVAREAVGAEFGVTDPAILSMLCREKRIEMQFDRDGRLIAAYGADVSSTR
jgi:biofilm PGA synthesis protein PgaD